MTGKLMEFPLLEQFTRLGNTRSAKAENNIVDTGETDTVDVADKSDNP